MASAEQLLNEAHFAFSSITAGDSRDNRRNAARARSLCKKIFRKYPGSSEAVVAHGIMMRLGVEAFPARIEVEHQHQDHADSHSASTPVTTIVASGVDEETVPFDWAGLLAVILVTSKTVLGAIGFAGLVLFSILGPFLLLPLLGMLLLTVPARQLLQPGQRQEVNKFVVQANAWIKERREAGTGLS